MTPKNEVLADKPAPLLPRTDEPGMASDSNNDDRAIAKLLNKGVIIAAMIGGFCAVIAAIINILPVILPPDANQTTNGQIISTPGSSQTILISQSTSTVSISATNPQPLSPVAITISETSTPVSVAQLASTSTEPATQETQATLTPTASPEPLLTATADTPTATPVLGCTTTPIQSNNQFELTIIRDADSLVFYLEEDQPDADLSQIGFEYSITTNNNGVRQQVRQFQCLRDYFTFLTTNLLQPGICLRLMRSGSTSLLPSVCNNTSFDFNNGQ